MAVNMVSEDGWAVRKEGGARELLQRPGIAKDAENQEETSSLTPARPDP